VDERANELSGGRLVKIKIHVVLAAVQLGDENVFFVGRPREVCQVVVGVFAWRDENGFAAGDVVNPDAWLFAGLADHRVFDAVEFARRLCHVRRRLIGAGALVFLVESQAISFGEKKIPSWIPNSLRAIDCPETMFGSLSLVTVTVFPPAIT